MDLLSKRNIKTLLKNCQAQPSKRLGQNFLVDKSALKKIIKAAGLTPNDIALEIGPGLGALAKELAEKAKKVIAVEKDPKMCKILKETLKGYSNVNIIQEDILKFEPKAYGLKPKTYKVVANLPYYITSPLIRKFLELKNPPKEMVLMVQKEVAQRICSLPPKMSLLAAAVQFYAKPKIISYVSRKSFWPQPKVDSAILQVAPLPKTSKKKAEANLFFKLVKAGFSQPRKQLANNLSKVLKLKKEEVQKWLLKNNIRPEQRAETLTVQNWINLTKSYKKLY